MTALAAYFWLNSLRDNLVEVRQSAAPMEIAKLSPLKFPPDDKPYEFNWLTEGYAHAWKSTADPQLRFRVFSQDRKVHDVLGPSTTQFLLKLWSYNFSELKIDHKPDYNRSCVDVYLCFSGDPGGQQLFDNDTQAKGISSKVNTIYIYDRPSFKEPLERVREISHEYGHASLPAIGGYDRPEYWANGYLGEKLFMTWLAKQNDLTADDLLGCEPEVLKNYIHTVCEPLIRKGATNFPSAEWLGGKKEESMNRYIGLMLWMQYVLPPQVFAQSMKLMRSYNPKDVPDAIVDACDGIDYTTISLPTYLLGKKVWLPFGRRKVTGVNIIGRSGNWIAVYAPATTISVR